MSRAAMSKYASEEATDMLRSCFRLSRFPMHCLPWSLGKLPSFLLHTADQHLLRAQHSLPLLPGAVASTLFSYASGPSMLPL